MSIKSQMQNKAVAMAEAAAARARTPQELEAIRQHLVGEVQRGTVPPYVGVPLIQDLTQKMTQAQAKMAQQVAGMGVPQAPQGAPIAQQIMAQAQQGAGVEALPSNLPQSYAPGGLVAFEEGGQVERYANDGLVKPGPFGGLLGMFVQPTLTPPEQERIKRLQEQAAERARGHYPTPQPDLGPVPGTDDSSILGGKLRYADMPDYQSTGAPTSPAAPPSVPQVGIGNLNLPTFKPTAAPATTDYMSLTKNLSKDAQSAFDTARTKEEDYLRSLTQPGEEAREKRFSLREAAIDKDSAMGRALNLMSLGFGIAGSKERTLAGALGNEGRQGIQALIQGEAANRVAKERLEDARDNFEQQKIAAKKGDRAAANAAGQRAADDVRAYGQLNLQAAHYGNSEANQRWQAQNSFGFQAAQLEQAGKLGIAGLQQQGAIANAQLKLGQQKLDILQEQIAAGNTRAKAALAGAQQKAYAAFQNDPQTRMLITEIQKKFGNLQHPDAQRQLMQARQTYMMNALPALLGAEGGGGSSIKDVAELLKD